MERQRHDALLTAELNEAYYRRRARPYHQWDMGLRIASALSSSGAIVTALSSIGPWPVVVLAAISAAASIATLVIRVGETANTYRQLAVEWTKVVADLRLDEGEDALRRALRRSEELQARDTLPRDDDLTAELQGKILAQHGLTDQPAT